MLADVADDPHDLAALLLREHGSVAAVIRAYGTDAASTSSIPDRVEVHLRKLSRAFVLSMRADAFDGVRIRSATALVDYLRHDMGELRQEAFRVLFLDGDNRLLSDRVLWAGSATAVQVHPGEVVRAVLEIGATAVIAVHNHPSGRAKPSFGDLAVTRHLVRLCQALEVEFQDHLIVTRGGVYSMRSGGDLQAMERELDATTPNAGSRR